MKYIHIAGFVFLFMAAFAPEDAFLPAVFIFWSFVIGFLIGAYRVGDKARGD